MPSATPPPELVETDAERRARPEEEQLLMEAERSFEAEGGIPFEEVRAWVASLSTGNPLPMPTPRKDEAWRRMTDTLAAEKAKARGT